MIANYGYKDGSGDYFIAIDTEKCNGCKDCVSTCPYGVMDVGPDENDPLSDEEVAFVTEAERTGAQRFYKSLGYEFESYKGFKKRIGKGQQIR